MDDYSNILEKLERLVAIAKKIESACGKTVGGLVRIDQSAYAELEQAIGEAEYAIEDAKKSK